MNTAILIIGYARPIGIARILEKLNDYGGNIYISIDGPKIGKNVSHLDEFRRVIKDFKNRNPRTAIDFRVREKNVGAAVNVIDSIDQCFMKEEQLIILEDDLTFSNSFIEYIEHSIKILKANSDIKMITGTNPFVLQSKNNLYSTYPIVWGWATTKDRWSEIRKAILEKKIENKNFKKRRMYNFFVAGKHQSLSGKVDAWDLPLAGSFHAYSWICLVPPVNLVTNHGFDSEATHTNFEVWPLGLVSETLTTKEIANLNFTHDKSLCIDSQMENFIYSIKRRHLFSPLKFRLNNLIKSPGANRLIERIKSASELRSMR